MASTMQSKHHARFHAAVLRYFFPPPSLPSDTQQEAPESVEGMNLNVQSLKSTELILEETQTDSEEVEIGKAQLSRAQRKRFKMKKVKETQLNATPIKGFIGPSLPHAFEKRWLENDDCISADGLLHENINLEKRSFSSSKGDKDFVETDKPEVLITKTGELAKSVREDTMSSLLETGEGKNVHGGVELELLSRAKRRRLAKKKFHDCSRCPTAASSFRAEIKGEIIIIKPI